MSLFRRLLTFLGAGGAGYQSEYKKEANIFSDYNLCSSVPFEKLVATLTSLATLSISEVRLVVSPSSTITMLTYQSTLKLYSSPTSAYSLSTSVT
jgi:hypothetical protein